MGELGVLVVTALAVVLFASSAQVLRDDERVVIFRLGRQMGVSGPGRVYLLPLIDRGIRVNLTERIPGWRGMSQAELNGQVVALALKQIRLK